MGSQTSFSFCTLFLPVATTTTTTYFRLLISFLSISLPLSSSMLPFQTMHEAELALGRTLTFAERLWFRYSAQMPDFLLYSHNTFFLFLFFSLAPLPLTLMEHINPKPLQKYKLQPKVHLSPQTFFKCYKDVIKVFILAVGPLQLFSYPAIKVRLSTELCEFHSLGSLDFEF